jgi:hypothetical protein
MILVVAVVAACAVDDGAVCAIEGEAEAAYDGFRWACANAPPCAVQVACEAPGWQRRPAAVLDRAAACMLGPCEERAACLTEAKRMCLAQAPRRDREFTQDLRDRPPPRVLAWRQAL